MDLVGHDFLTLLDFTPAEIGGLLELAAELKAKKKAGIPHDTLRGKNVALIFEKTSTRTRCEEFARLSGGSVTLTEDTDAVAGADAVYTDVWVSMGEPTAVWEERINALAPYQVNAALMAKAKHTAVFMHCLPAYHDHKTAIGREMGERFGRAEMEVTDEVFTSRQSIVFQEAENRMHTIKAVMAATLGA